MNGQSLILLRPRPDTVYLSNGRTVLATQTDGFLSGHADQGLFVHETRLISHYRYKIEAAPLYRVSSSHVTQRSWLGYYIAPFPERSNSASANVNAAAQNAIELLLSRTLGEGMHEHVNLSNHTQSPVRLTLIL